VTYRNQIQPRNKLITDTLLPGCRCGAGTLNVCHTRS